MPVLNGLTIAAPLAPLVLELLVALHAELRIVLGLAFLPRDLDAVDPAVARVQELQIIDHSVRRRNSVRGVGPRAVDEERKEYFAGRHRGYRNGGQTDDRRSQDYAQFLEVHDVLP